MQKSYNGWTNYETWAVALWLDNEKTIYHAIQAIGKNYTKEDTHYFADAIEEFVKNLPSIERVTAQSTLAADLLGAALEEVDWYSVAEHYQEEQ